MKHTGTVLLETEHLLLRPFTVEDAPQMYRNYACDPEVTRFLTWPPHASVEVTRALLEDWVARYDEPTVYNWVIVEKDCGEAVGSISIVNQDEFLAKMEVGYCLGRAWWGKGYMTEALSVVRDHLFSRVDVLRLQAKHDVDNPSSGRVMEKCGMAFEGVLRKSAWNNQGIKDMAYRALLKEDWEMIQTNTQL